MGSAARISLRGSGLNADNRSVEVLDEQIRQAQVHILFRTAPSAIIAAMLTSMLLVVGVKLFYRLDDRVMLTWIAVHISTFSFIEGIAFLYWRTPKETRNWRLWARWFVFATFLGGLGWGLGVTFLLAPATLEEELLITLVASVVASGTVLALGSYLPAVFANFVPLILPMMMLAASRGDGIHYFLTFSGVAYIGGISLLARMYCRNLTTSIRLEFENRSLIADLRAQKEAAEQANIDKSRFLAAASHDLRQPVHALSMFVGALADKPLPRDSREIVAHISDAVESMDGLFNALLDISKLDAGVVQPEAKAFAIGALLERIAREFKSRAEEKGLRLIVCDCSVVVTSAPVPLENILRNLLSNAIRYTEQGRILIGCRRGSLLRVEVHDTGIGIPSGQLAKVFEEFYQIGNVERDRRRGLGLGLAIVKRTAALIGCDIEIESEVGRGTLVAVHVPIADAQILPPIEPDAANPDDPTAAVIFVIDDEPSVREATSLLLNGWGHEVFTAESGEQILEIASACPRRPDIVICDYRLRNEENGIELLKRLQDEYNSPIGGILLTGDTAPERLAEARQSGFIILHKPLSSGKLRAAVRSACASRRRLEAE